MKFGGPVFGEFTEPRLWAQAARAEGYSAVYCPVGAEAGAEEVQAYVRAAAAEDLVIAEVGAWSNPLSPKAEAARQALEYCCRQLDLADRVGARCCVNISGSRGETWDGHHPLNLTAETFDLVVATTRRIIDTVQPTRTFFTLETMPWMYPDSVDSYVRLIAAVDRAQFAVHFDPVNLICSPQRYFSTGAIIRDFVERLGPHIRSCHAKDISLSTQLTTHLDEVRPGLGNLDYRTFFREITRLEPEVCVMMEHLSSAEEYREAAAHLRGVAAEEGISL